MGIDHGWLQGLFGPVGLDHLGERGADPWRCRQLGDGRLPDALDAPEVAQELALAAAPGISPALAEVIHAYWAKQPLEPTLVDVHATSEELAIDDAFSSGGGAVVEMTGGGNSRQDEGSSR